MRRARVAVAVVFVFLFAIPNLPRTSIAQTNGLIDESAVKAYADSLISNYNALVSEYQATQPNFTANKQYFWMYNDGGSFKVLVMWKYPNNYSALAFIFEPIASSGPDVVVDYNDTYVSYTGYTATTPGNNYTFGFYPYFGAYGDVFFDFYTSGTNGPARSLFFPLIFFATPALVTNDEGGTNSYNAAVFVYQSNLDFIRRAQAYFSQTSTQTASTISLTDNFGTTTTRTVPIQCQGSTCIITDNPVVKLIDAVFGSLFTFAIVVAIAVVAIWKRRVVEEALGAIHLRRPSNMQGKKMDRRENRYCDKEPTATSTERKNALAQY
jgi:hypothetical protein